ncbi:MAG: GTP 3',8-cyclase MoaA [Polyangiaceae bacterium]
MNLAILPLERLLRHPVTSADGASPAGPVVDRRGRQLLDLRLSVTDRCNFHCVYCRPHEDGAPKSAPAEASTLLDFPTLTEIARAFVELGVTKVRITGGEPLLRPKLVTLIEALSRLGIPDLCMTTNGSLLARNAKALKDAGLKRVTVSLDAIDELTFRRTTGGATSLPRVLEGIDVARKHGLGPVKINQVVKRGLNDHTVLAMADWARREGLELRFIEYMDVGRAHAWRADDVVTAKEIRQLLQTRWPMEAAPSDDPRAPATRYRYRDGGGYVGFVASVSEPFCGTCTRARVTAQGRLHTCLFSPFGVDLADVLRNGRDLKRHIQRIWQWREDRYSEFRDQLHPSQVGPEMIAMGG